MIKQVWQHLIEFINISGQKILDYGIGTW